MFKAVTASCDYRLFFVYCDLIFASSLPHEGPIFILRFRPSRTLVESFLKHSKADENR